MTTLRLNQVACRSTDLLVVVESVRWEQHKSVTGCYAYGLLEPVAVVIGTRNDVHAFDMSAERTDLEHLKGQLPELKSVIATFLNAESPNLI